MPVLRSTETTVAEAMTDHQTPSEQDLHSPLPWAVRPHHPDEGFGTNAAAITHPSDSDRGYSVVVNGVYRPDAELIVAAVNASAIRSPGLDVERLAEAIFNVTTSRGHSEHDSGECETCWWFRKLSTEVADDAAAEYARLLRTATPASYNVERLTAEGELR